VTAKKTIVADIAVSMSLMEGGMLEVLAQGGVMGSSYCLNGCSRQWVIFEFMIPTSSRSLIGVLTL
jgi:hypothetical protein